MDPSVTSAVHDPFAGTVSDELDRLEITASKIGQIKAGEAFGLLYGLDEVYRRIQELGNETQSRRLIETQFKGIVAKMHSEAGRFIRDLGGLSALQQAREKRQPAADHEWWYLDTWLARRRQASLKRTLIFSGGIIMLLLIMGVIYQKYLAPDPQVAARYGFEQSAQDFVINGNYEEAMKEVEQGLKIVPQDPSLLTLKGVLQENLGQADQAALSFAQAEKGLPTRADFLVTRSQVYLMANQIEKGLADAQEAVKINPQSAQAYLVLGQSNEMMAKYPEAMEYYDKAYENAEKSGQTELAAITRMRKAMIMQMMNNHLTSPTSAPTLSPGD